MKIGIFDPYLDDLGGGEKYMMIIAKCLSNDNEVFIFWDEKKDLEDLEERFLLDFSNVTLTKNIFSKDFSLFGRLIESKKYDVIIYLSNGSIPFLLSKKSFLHVQQPLPEKNLNLKTKLKLSRIYGIFCNSIYTKTFTDKHWKVNASVLYPPIVLKPKEIKKENIILHVGRFRVKNVGVDDYKKQGFMIDIFKKMIVQGLKNWKFILAVSIKKTDEKIFDDLRKKTEGFPIEFVVNKNNNDLWETYSRARIYWHASGFGENLEKFPEYAEHFGISTVEAMGAGVVPVVINAGGQKEIVENSKNGFLWDSIDELIEKTKILTENEDKWKKMSKEAIKRAKFFAGDRFCKDLNRILGK